MGAELVTTSGDSGNAMTEIALALAMAFFAIMILTMVSMGAGGSVQTTQAAPEIAMLLPSATVAANDNGPAAANDNAAPATTIAAKRIVVFADDQFFNAALQPIEPAAAANMDQPVLAVSPDLSIAEVMAANRFILWLVPTVEKFPRSQKFLLGDRLQATALEVLEHLVEATYTRRRAELLLRANLGVEKLRFLFRLALDLGHLDARRYEHAARSLDEVGRLIGGWRKASGDAPTA
ncbi:MAG: diversity-generating retroelement protein Avd [Alphaproteobacteria bacterium]|nr:diversity-generating retroelement protein Avd [Alphaproteobacteria bacterium]